MLKSFFFKINRSKITGEELYWFPEGSPRPIFSRPSERLTGMELTSPWIRDDIPEEVSFIMFQSQKHILIILINYHQLLHMNSLIILIKRYTLIEDILTCTGNVTLDFIIQFHNAYKSVSFFSFFFFLNSWFLSLLIEFLNFINKNPKEKGKLK